MPAVSFSFKYYLPPFTTWLVTTSSKDPYPHNVCSVMSICGVRSHEGGITRLWPKGLARRRSLTVSISCLFIYFSFLY